MAHPTRGHRSATYEIEEIVDLDTDKLAITVRHAAAYLPQVVSLSVEHSPAAEQMLQAMADSIKVSTNGDIDSGWESIMTLQYSSFFARVMVERLHDAGFRTFDDRRIDVPVLRQLYAPLNAHIKRSACWLLARVVRDNHPNGAAVSVALKNTRIGVEDSKTFTYDDDLAGAIEDAARAVYRDAVEAQRDVFGVLGYDVSGRRWLHVSAEEVIGWARRAHPALAETSAPQPSPAAPEVEQVAWAVTHPEWFGLTGSRSRRLAGRRMARLGRALYPDNVTITAALIVHCLGENAGFNLSVLLEKNADSLTHLGDDHALEHNVKARSKTEDTRPTYLGSMFNPGGVIERMAALTRFSRLARAALVSSDGSTPAVVNRLYVEHTSVPSKAQVITSARIHNAWRSPAFGAHWDVDTFGDHVEIPLRMRALRLVAQRRAMGEGLKADVHGHGTRTKVHYSAHVLPDYVFNKHATAAQDAFHDEAKAAFTVAGATEGVAAELAAIPAEQIMDVEIGLCTSGGNSPDGSGRRCELGMGACFTCPNGYRTIDHVPGLLAAVELGDIIERNDPDEWANGQASDLRYYAQACLDQFPPQLVGNLKRTTDLVPHILTVTGMYMELRHG